jgi:hypothetical protein
VSSLGLNLLNRSIGLCQELSNQVVGKHLVDGLLANPFLLVPLFLKAGVKLSDSLLIGPAVLDQICLHGFPQTVNS